MFLFRRLFNFDIPGPDIGPDWQQMSLKVSKLIKLLTQNFLLDPGSGTKCAAPSIDLMLTIYLFVNMWPFESLPQVIVTNPALFTSPLFMALYCSTIARWWVLIQQL